MVPSSSGEHSTPLGIVGGIRLLTHGASITFGLSLKAVKALAGGNKKDRRSVYEYVAFEGLHDFQSGLNAVAIQNVLPGTVSTCRRFARRHKITFSTVELQDGSVVPWLGPRKVTNKLVVLFHGGGYMAPALEEQVWMAFGFEKNIENSHSVVVLPYALATEDANHYPRQLHQAALLTNHLLGEEGIPPSQIVYIGDSAGGHLLLGLLLHFRHPHPELPPVQLDGNLHGAALISPWVDVLSTCESLKANVQKDYLGIPALAYWGANFMGPAKPDAWNSPLTGPEEWWKDLPVKHMLVTYGQDEMFRDDAATMSRILKAAHPQVVVTAAVGEVHEQMLMDRFLRLNKSCESEKAFLGWLKERIGEQHRTE